MAGPVCQGFVRGAAVTLAMVGAAGKGTRQRRRRRRRTLSLASCQSAWTLPEVKLAEARTACYYIYLLVCYYLLLTTACRLGIVGGRGSRQGGARVESWNHIALRLLMLSLPLQEIDDYYLFEPPGRGKVPRAPTLRQN